jgi:spore coat protein CotF
MNDELLLNNYLLNLKSTIEVYIHGTLESSNSDVRSILHDGLDETLSCQAILYETMVDNGYYEVDNVKSNQIKQVYNKVSEDDN